jgi:hypothetical protein
VKGAVKGIFGAVKGPNGAVSSGKSGRQSLAGPGNPAHQDEAQWRGKDYP